MSWWPWRRPVPEPTPGWVDERLERLVRPAALIGWQWVCQEVRTEYPSPDTVVHNTERGVGLTFPTTTRTVLESGWRLTERGARLAAHRAEARDGRGKWLRG